MEVMAKNFYIYIIAGIIILLIILGTAAFISKYRMPTAEIKTPTAQQLLLEKEMQTEEEKAAQENLVTYTDSGYAPNTLKVKVGAIVTFINKSSQPVRPASAFHPTHAVYPTTGGCIGSTFDACAKIAPGNSWSFQFDIVGSWKYHNHLNPKRTGAIIVEQF